MNEKNMAVLINIIGAVESGGQVYGKRRYDAYAAPYTNSPNEHTVTLGWAQNYGENARKLVQAIFDADSTAFRKIDTTGKIKNMLSKDWVTSKWKPTAKQKNVLIALIDSKTGHRCQDELFAQDMRKYIKDCEEDYTSDVKAQMMYCEIRHLGGKGSTDRIFWRLNGDYDLDVILASLAKDQRDTTNDNQVGDVIYWSRHVKCRQFIEKYAEEESVFMTKTEKAIRQMEDWARDDSHGYDQVYRWGQYGDYDCSASVIQAWENAGVPVKSGGATYTGNMFGVFVNAGFVDVTSKVNRTNGAGMLRGDVLLNVQNHVAMYCGNGKEVEASINEYGGATGGQPGDQTGFEFLIRSYRNYPWDYVLRYPEQQEGVFMFKVKELKKGAKGQDVRLMQQNLKGWNIKDPETDKYTKVDGFFGPSAERTLIEFQKKTGAYDVLGECTQKTWKRLLRR